MDRREFLMRGGTVALLSSVPLLGTSCKGADDPGPPGVDAPLLAKLDGAGVEILNLAARAPSGHNTQPWLLRIEDAGHWVIGIAASRRLPAVDPTARETLLSLGAFLENLIVAAAHYGYAGEYEVIARSPSDSDVIDLRLKKVEPQAQRLDQIRLRRTVRNGFLAREFQSADVAELGYGEGLHYFARGSAGAKYLSEGTLEANRQQAFRDPAEEELADWIRWSAADAAKYRNGLTPASMEINGVAGFYVSHFYKRATVLSRSFRETTIKQASERVGQGGGWLVVASGAGEIASLIETGRRVERMWLQLRDRKIAIHPMTQMLEEGPWREQVGKGLGIDGVPQFLLRVGYVDAYPPPVSVRMPAGWIAQ